MSMLTKDDLTQIGEIVRTEIRKEVDPLKDQILSLEETMSVKFDAVHDELQEIRNEMVTKSYLDDKLAHYQRKPF